MKKIIHSCVPDDESGVPEDLVALRKLVDNIAGRAVRDALGHIGINNNSGRGRNSLRLEAMEWLTSDSTEHMSLLWWLSLYGVTDTRKAQQMILDEMRRIA